MNLSICLSISVSAAPMQKLASKMFLKGKDIQDKIRNQRNSGVLNRIRIRRYLFVQYTYIQIWFLLRILQSTSKKIRKTSLFKQYSILTLKTNVNVVPGVRKKQKNSKKKNVIFVILLSNEAISRIRIRTTADPDPTKNATHPEHCFFII